MKNTSLGIIIIDDEQDACHAIKDAIMQVSDAVTHIHGIANNTRLGEKLIHLYHPDVVFLDIEMPHENAFQFLERIAPVHFEIVFVSAYDEFAIKAFRLNALDYILKPIHTDEIKNVLYRVQAQRMFRHYLKDMEYMGLQQQVRNAHYTDKIVLKENNERVVVSFNDILFVEAHGSYSRIFFSEGGSIKSKLTSNNIAEYEYLFPDNFFYRVHKSYLVNCRYIDKVTQKDGFHLKLKESYELPVSRRRYSGLIAFLKHHSF